MINFSSVKRNLKGIKIFSGINTVCLIGILLCLIIIEQGPVCDNRDITLKQTKHGLFLALIPNDFVSEYIKCNSIWEPDVTNYLISNVKPGDIVVECGANIGYYTTLLSRLVTKTGKVYSYDANPEVLQLADLSVKMNGFSDTAVLKNACVSNKCGTAKFKCLMLDPYKFIGCSNIGKSHIVADTDAVTSEESNCASSGYVIHNVNTITLDSDLNDVKQIDWLRMDIEGAEILAIQGAKRLIEASPNIKIVIEWCPKMMQKYGKVEELVDYLFKSGFSANYILNNGTLEKEVNKEELMNIDLIDIVFSRKNAVKQSIDIMAAKIH